MRLNKDAICGLVITGVGIILYVEVTRSVDKLGYDALDSPFFPKLGAVMLSLFGMALAISSFWKSAESKKIQVNNPVNVVSYIILLFLYCLLLSRIGFIFSTVVFVTAGCLIIGRCRKIKDFVYSIVFASSATIILWLIFVKGLNLLLT